MAQTPKQWATTIFLIGAILGIALAVTVALTRSNGIATASAAGDAKVVAHGNTAR